jgi:5-methylcytosine-specific restriction protein B
MQDKLDTILSDYLNAQGGERFGKSSSIWRVMEAWKDELVSSDVVRNHPEIRIEFSIGKGNWAGVPWLALMDGRLTDSIRHGVYCVYLFREDMSGVYLTLMQGVTDLIEEHRRPEAHRMLRDNARSIRDVYTGLGHQGFSLDEGIDLRASTALGRDYEPSTIAYKLYETGRVPDDRELTSDLQTMLTAYDGYATSRPQDMMNGGEDRLAMLAKSFQADAVRAGLRLSATLAIRLTASLLSKRFLILTGLSGSGKTKVAQSFARWITSDVSVADQPCYAIVPVGADWTGNENVLGYPDGLDRTSYVTTPILRLIQHSLEHASSPHFLILDEMNLSHVERYFADLLSAIESEESIPLYSAIHDQEGGKILRRGVPESLELPRNLFVVGTVNVDETTYMFSPKVLDRANVIEFKVELDDLESFLTDPTAPLMAELDGKGSLFGALFVASALEAQTVLEAGRQEQFAREMRLFFGILRQHGAEFGYRVIHESARFLHFYNALDDAGGSERFDSAFDAVIVQKLLPKLHGSRSKLEGLLWALAWACGAPRAPRDGLSFEEQTVEAGRSQDETKFGPEVVWSGLASRNALEPSVAATYPLSFDKVIRMWRRLVRDQFVSFAEA